MNILIARSMGVSTFGAFSIAFGVYVIFQNLSRALTSEPLVIRYSQVESQKWSLGTGQAAGTAVIIGSAGGIACLAAAWLLSGELAIALLGMGLVLPGVLLQDLWRYAFFASGRGSLALMSDLIWAILMFPAFLIILAGQDPSLLIVVAAWGVSATIAGVIASLVGGVFPSILGIRIWITNHRDLTKNFMGEMATTSIAGQVSLLGIGGVAGLSAVGAYRAAQVIFGPLRIVYQGLSLFGVPEGVRFLKESAGRLRRTALVTATLLALMSLFYGMFLILLPETWGLFLLKDAWAATEPLIVPFALGMTGLGITMAALIGLRALEAAKQSFQTRLVIASGDLVATVLGATVGGALGAAWAGRTVAFLGSGLWWKVFLGQLRRRGKLEDQADEHRRL
jgi:O-antigen/teichoic acid export membrane protein